MTHRIAHAAFTEARQQGIPQGSASVTCDCGETVTADTFSAHRKQAGAPYVDRIMARDSAYAWNKQYRRRVT